jgi:hypothetical protein
MARAYLVWRRADQRFIAAEILEDEVIRDTLKCGVGEVVTEADVQAGPELVAAVDKWKRGDDRLGLLTVAEASAAAELADIGEELEATARRLREVAS